jgi:hypothetical protein
MHSIYIESADEITTVIERLKEASDAAVALVAPKGASLLQSLVNLKLARKAAADAGKTIVIVTTDKIGRNLCSQLGITVVSSEEAAAAAFAGEMSDEPADTDPKVVAGVRVHTYFDEEAADNDADVAQPEPIIIPKEMMTKKEAEAAPQEPIVVPDTTPTATPQAEPMARRTIARDDAPAAKAAPGGNNAAAKKVASKEKALSSNDRRVLKLSTFFSAVALAGFAALALLFLPITEVTLLVRATDWDRQVELTASTTKETGGPKHVPAEIVSVTVEGNHAFDATGVRRVGEKATGEVTFYNYDSTSAVTVPAGTRITANGRAFTTTEAVSIPGFTQAGGGAPRVPGTKKAPVTADEVGPESNVKDTNGIDIRVNNILLSSSVTTSGGSSQEIKVISNQDLMNAREALETLLKEKAIAKLKDSLSNREVIAKDDADIFEMGNVSSDTPVGSEAQRASVTGSLSLKRTVINKSSLNDVLVERLRAEQREDRSYEITKREFTITTLAEDGTNLTLLANVAGKEAPIIRQEELPKKLAGASLAEGEQIVQAAAPAATVQIEHTPRWWPLKRYPTFDRYIKVSVQYE